MVVRLLVVVLTLLGAIPVRVCTCGAAHHHHPSPPTLPAEHPDQTSPGVSEGDGAPVRPPAAGIHKRRAAMSLAVPLSRADTPADVAVAFTPAVSAAGLILPFATPIADPRSPDPPGRPRYI